MKIRKNVFFLGVIVLFFLVTRLYKIAEIPGSVYWDEASIGYNAYSIGTDLKDEWGQTLPLHFRAFGEFKLPVYIYSVVPFVKILGLNALAVRLPAVLYSLGSIFLIYLLVKKITDKESLGVLSAFLLSVSPWLFIFSRTGYEATSGLFFTLLGTHLVLSVEKKNIYYLLGVLSFVLSFYSYNSFRIIGPILLAALTLYKISKKRISIVILSFIVFVASLIPVYRLYKFDNGASRFAQVGVSNINQIVKNYFANFSPDFLYMNGDTNPRSQVPGSGELYYLDIIFIILGIVYIVKSKKVINYLPILILLLAPIPAALTKESPHALRAIFAAPGFVMITTFGIFFFIEKFRKYSKYVLPLIVVGYLIFFGFHYFDFIKNYNDKTRDAWQYQYKETFASQNSGVVGDKYGQPYIFALFYQKYSPTDFRKTVVYNPVSDWGFSLVSSFNGFEFKK